MYSTIDADDFGFECHANGSTNWNVVNILDGTEVTTGDAVFLVKKVNSEFNIDNSTVKSTETGVLVQIIDNDDDYVGVDVSGDTWGLDNALYGHTVDSHMPTFNESFSEEDGYSSSFAADTSASKSDSYDTSDNWECNVNLTNGTYEGDLWNSSGYVGSNAATTMTVTIGDGTNSATLTGIISAGEFKHTKKSFSVGDGDWSNADYLGHVTNQKNWNGVNNVNVVIKSGATWNITGNGIITGFTNDGSISGGTVTENSDGTWTIAVTN
ncbi:MAG: hypothetical protein PQJ46_04600 [Spirochaetales bacterium]|nr:hypothetical protein [Spirochaetales bacterium]